jgi:hypothetical protein
MSWVRSQRTALSGSSLTKVGLSPRLTQRITLWSHDIPDPRLRSELRQAVNELRSARTFGLV